MLSFFSCFGELCDAVVHCVCAFKVLTISILEQTKKQPPKVWGCGFYCRVTSLLFGFLGLDANKTHDAGYKCQQVAIND